jgi:hypothetical protein
MSAIIDGTNGITVPTPVTVPNGGTGATTSTGTGSVVLSSSPTITTPTIARINSTSSNTPTLFYDNSGNQIGTLCRAWVQYTVSGSTNTINGSFNVSSITYNSAGYHTVNFTNSLPDVNYCVNASASASSANSELIPIIFSNTSGAVTPNASYFYLTFGKRSDGSFADPVYACVSVFR